MRKVAFIIILMLDISIAKSQVITKYQYWFDNNFSNHYTLNLIPGVHANVDSVLKSSLDSLSDGLHRIHLRIGQSNGLWSVVITRIFVKQSIMAAHLTHYRYWFNDQIENAKIISTTNNSSLDIHSIFNLESLSDSKHKFSCQIGDNRGYWSAVIADSFDKGPVLSHIEAIPLVKNMDHTGQYLVGSLVNFEGHQFFPSGRVQLNLIHPDHSKSIITSPLTDINGNFTKQLSITSDFNYGEYRIEAYDVSKNQYATGFSFFVNKNVIANPKIITPNSSSKYEVGEFFNITWQEFNQYSGLMGFTGLILNGYKIEYSNDNGTSWNVIDQNYQYRGVKLGAINTTASFRTSLNSVGMYKIRVSNNNNPSHFIFSDNFEIIAGPNATSPYEIKYYWDKSAPDYGAAIEGLAADGAARIILSIKKKPGAPDITNIHAFVQSEDNLINILPTDIDMYGKIFYVADKGTVYSDTANQANSTEQYVTPSNQSLTEHFFYYVAPNDFCQDLSNQNRERKLRIGFNIQSANSTSTTMYTKYLRIVRPPLMWVHGISGDADSWSKAKYIQGGNEQYFNNSDLWIKQSHVAYASQYGYQKSARALLNPSATRNTFAGLISDMRREGFACNRVDYIAHSMGGAVGRYMINELCNLYWIPRSDYLNYRRGFINKLITVNTPHNGSPVADLIYDEYDNSKSLKIASYALRRMGQLPGHFFAISTRPSFGLRDLQFQDGIKLSQTTGVRNHLIASDLFEGNGNSVGDNFLPGFLDLYQSKVYNLLEQNGAPSYYLNTGNDELYSNSDITVPVSSQLANSVTESIYTIDLQNYNHQKPRSLCLGLTSAYFNLYQSKDYSDEIESKLNRVTHANITDNLIVGTQVLTLLNVSINSAAFSSTINANVNIPISNNSTGSKSPSTMPINLIDSNRIKIITPTSLGNFQILTDSVIEFKFHIKDTTHLKRIVVMHNAEIIESSSRAEYQSFYFQASAIQSDSSLLFVMATYDSLGVELNVYDSVKYICFTNDTLFKFYVEDSVVTINPNTEFNLDLKCIYNSVVRELFLEDTSLNIVIADTNVVCFNPQYKQLIAKDTGTTYIVFNYMGLIDTAYVYVSWFDPNIVYDKLSIHLRVLLSGPYAGESKMNEVLFNQTADSTYIGVCDEVCLKLCSHSYPFEVVDSSFGMVDQYGYADFNFSDSMINQTMYLQIVHRNSISTWCNQPQRLLPGMFYDFTTSASKAYGDNQVEVEPGVFALYSGDFNQDDNIDLLDMALLENDIAAYQYGYFNTDLNGDGNVDLLDNPVLENNLNLFIFSMHP